LGIYPFDEDSEVQEGGIGLEELENTILQVSNPQSSAIDSEILDTTHKVEGTVFWEELINQNPIYATKLEAAKDKIRANRFLEEEQEDKPDISHLRTKENLEDIDLNDLLQMSIAPKI
jgi:hypothetical protein